MEFVLTGHRAHYGEDSAQIGQGGCGHTAVQDQVILPSPASHLCCQIIFLFSSILFEENLFVMTQTRAVIDLIDALFCCPDPKIGSLVSVFYSVSTLAHPVIFFKYKLFTHWDYW